MNKISDSLLSIKKTLQESEKDYFLIGSKNKKLEYGIFSKNEEFKKLPSGLIIHDIDLNRFKKNEQKFLNEIKNLFQKEKSLFFRVYLPYDKKIDEYFKNHAQVKITYEVGLVKEITSYVNYKKNNSKIIPIKFNDSKLWEIKNNLYKKSHLGPDGHNLEDKLFCDFEKDKCKLSYMQSYLYYFKNIPIATVSLALNRKFARIKNLFIIPEYRNQGFGKDIVLRLFEEAKKNNAEYIGVYAIENSNGHKLYSSCGMKSILKQIELYGEL